MKEIVIISGKGGTGKTSIAASFAALANGTAVMADCDVDAADLHLVLQPKIMQSTPFYSGHKAFIRQNDCESCGLCQRLCRFAAVSICPNENTGLKQTYTVDPVACEGCGVCVRFCPSKAIDFPEEKCGDWYISTTRFGGMVHAILGVASENSGRLVTLVRKEAKELGVKNKADYLLIDGSPGIGCPVIASLTATDLACIVTEPTVSGLHDLKRIMKLVQQLSVRAVVCVNKWDVNPEIKEQIEAFTLEQGMTFAGGIRYDTVVTQAQRCAKTIVEYRASEVVEEIKHVWSIVCVAVRNE